MRIGIDARVMTLSASGIGRYSIEMIKAISKLNQTKNHQFILFSSRKSDKLNLPENWSYFEGSISDRALLRSLNYSNLTKKLNLDRFYTMDYIGPIISFDSNCKIITTIHDLIPIIYPNLTSFKHRLIGKYILPLSINNASTIISISHSTKNDIIKHLNVDPKKIKVIHSGVSDIFFENKLKASEELINNFTLDSQYILFFGTLEPKKNIYYLIDSYSKISNSLKRKYKLVLCGKIDINNSKLTRFILKRNLKDRIIFTEFVSDEKLKFLIQNARVFCFPSLYEGFGLPIIESMACGCPVIASNVSSIPEITGDAAILVDPRNVEELVTALNKILTDDKLRKDLSKKSYLNSSKYRWQNSASKVFQTILS